jgi:hypothetical protein
MVLRVFKRCSQNVTNPFTKMVIVWIARPQNVYAYAKGAVHHFGPAVDGIGHIVDDAGPIVIDIGPLVDKIRPVVDGAGHTVDHFAAIVDEIGPTVDHSGAILAEIRVLKVYLQGKGQVLQIAVLVLLTIPERRKWGFLSWLAKFLTVQVASIDKCILSYHSGW